MAIDNVAFNIADGMTSSTVASGTLQIDDSDDKVVGISGAINGVVIDGLSTFDGADQQLSERDEFLSPGQIHFGYNVDTNGVGFTAGGVQYDLMATANSNGMLGQGSQTGDNLASSSGSQETVSFTANNTRSSIPTCFTTGTRLETLRGRVAVENLKAGDQVVTASGGVRTIIWIGHRSVRCDAGDHQARPVRISAHAFGKDQPTHPIMLSPGHPVLVGADAEGRGGVLVPIMCLINGTSIEPLPMDEVTYWHVELDRHDILLAVGLPAESYLDWGDRGFFSEGADHALANPDFVIPGLAGRCRPVALDGPIIESERRRLDSVFAMRLAAACVWPAVSTTLDL